MQGHFAAEWAPPLGAFYYDVAFRRLLAPDLYTEVPTERSFRGRVQILVRRLDRYKRLFGWQRKRLRVNLWKLSS